MSGIQHRNACGEIDVLVALNILQRGVFWAKKLHITPTPRGVAERRR